MSRAIGGYVRRCERRYVPAAPDRRTTGPRWLRHAVMPSGAIITWRDEPPPFEMPRLSPAFLPIEVPEAAGGFLASLFGTSEPGPPYVHTFVPPAPCPTDCDPDCELNPDGCHERHEVTQARDHDPDECEASRRPGPAFTLTERS